MGIYKFIAVVIALAMILMPLAALAGVMALNLIKNEKIRTKTND